jgi:phage gp46-like protein
MPTPTPTLSEGQRAYEARRAAKAGVSLEKWLADKQKQANQAARAAAKAAEEARKPPKKPGIISRLLDRAHKPL